MEFVSRAYRRCKFPGDIFPRASHSRGAPPFMIFKEWGFRFRYDWECAGGGSEKPHPCSPRRTRMGARKTNDQPIFSRARESIHSLERISSARVFSLAWTSSRGLPGSI